MAASILATAMRCGCDRHRQGPMQVVAPRRRVSAANPHQLLVLMVVTSALMTLIAYLFLRNQLRPIKRLAEAAEAFGKGRAVPYRPARRHRGAGGRHGIPGHAGADRTPDRAAHADAVGRQPRPAHAADPAEAGAVDAGCRRRGRGADAATSADMERLVDEFLAFARGDALDDPVDDRSGRAAARQSVADAARSGGKVTHGRRRMARAGGAAPGGGAPRAGKPDRQCPALCRPGRGFADADANACCG